MQTGLETSSDEVTGVVSDLVSEIRQKVSEGVLAPGELIGSEYEMSRRTGLSRALVRRAIGILVKDGVVQRRAGRGVFAGGSVPRTRRIQIVVPNMASPQCMAITQGAQLAARNQGVDVQIYDACGDTAHYRAELLDLPTTGMHGAIVMVFADPSLYEPLFELKQKGFPLVLIDMKLQEIQIPSVTVDNYAGGYAVGKLLVELGHRRIAFIGTPSASSVRDRLQGLSDSMSDSGLPIDRRLFRHLEVDPMDDWSEAITESVQQLLGDSNNRPTALFCHCDAVAARAYRAIRSMGLSIPDDISVVGFDGSPVGELLEPTLTTVRQPSSEQGGMAITMLLELMNSTRGKAVRHEMLPTELVVRESTARIKKA